MANNKFVKIDPNGTFILDNNRWYCNSAVYFGRFPGTCGCDWLTEESWAKNESELSRDYGNMAEIGINHAALFFHMDAFFKDGKVLESGMNKVDKIIESAKANDVRVTLFCGPFIDTPERFKQVTGEDWVYDENWLPSFNPALHDAYVQQAAAFANRYKNEPTVAAYTDRIDRFHKGFDNISIPFNLKEKWIEWLKARYGSFDELMKALGGAHRLENNPQDWKDILLPHESKWNGSLHNPLAYDFILMQKKEIGDAQAQFDSEIKKIAPEQFIWTPFEGNTNTWAMLDGFTPETKKLQAIWMEYYFFEMTRPSFVQPFEEWAHTREVVHRRLSHEIPVVYNTAYAMTKYLKKSVQQPVVICHGGWIDSPAYGTETEEHQAAIIDRVNAACLAAGGDGWHYWCWRDDNQSWTSHKQLRHENPTSFYFHGESLGLYDFNGYPRPSVSVARRYSRELKRRELTNVVDKTSDVLMLSTAARMYNLFRRMALPTASAVNGALTRLGVEADYLWTAQNDIRISQETLNKYKFIVIADNMFGRDFTDTPEKLLKYVEQGGTLYFAMDKYNTFEDQYGNPLKNDAMTKLTGVDPNGFKEWEGYNDYCKNWPYETDASEEPNMDVQAFPRVAWGITKEFRNATTYAQKLTLLGFRSTDDDTFTVVPGLVSGAEVISVGKFAAGTRPFLYRHNIGKGTVYVNAWTNNIFRDNETRVDYGGWEFDWVLDIPLQTSSATDVDLTRGASVWLRNSWGYFWKDIC